MSYYYLVSVYSGHGEWTILLVKFTTNPCLHYLKVSIPKSIKKYYKEVVCLEMFHHQRYAFGFLISTVCRHVSGVNIVTFTALV